MENFDDTTPSDRVNIAVKKCMNMRPDTVDSDFYKNLRMKITNSSDWNSNARQLRSNCNINDKKKIEDMLREFSGDFSNLHKKFDAFASNVVGLIDRVESMETRIATMEAWKHDAQSTSRSVSYASIVQNGNIDENSTSDRIGKLEYSGSEDERKNKLLHLQLTHPSLDSNSPFLSLHVQNFLKQHLKMSPREIDVNMVTYKSSRPHTVIIKCSDRSFKLFVYSARKKLRSDSPHLCEDLFINDDLTSYNFSLLKCLKNERKQRIQDGKANFETVYSYNGKIFVKILRTDITENAIHIKIYSCMNSLV